MAVHDLFYTNAFLDVAGFHNPTSAPKQIEFIEQTVPLRPDDKILDLACGLGRHSIPLAQRGYTLVGFERSLDYIAKATTECERLNLEVRFEQGDMRELSVSEEFDVVLSLQSSLAFYDEETNKDIFKRISKALRTGGTFVFDQANIFSFAAHAFASKPTIETLPDGRTHCRTLSFDAETCVGSGRSILESDGKQDESGWDLRYYTLPELKALSREIGLNIVGHYGDWDGAAYTSSRLSADSCDEKTLKMSGVLAENSSGPPNPVLRVMGASYP